MIESIPFTVGGRIGEPEVSGEIDDGSDLAHERGGRAGGFAGGTREKDRIESGELRGIERLEEPPEQVRAPGVEVLPPPACAAVGLYGNDLSFGMRCERRDELRPRVARRPDDAAADRPLASPAPRNRRDDLAIEVHGA